MAAPQVEYVKTRDGVRIAFSAFGSGPVLLWPNGSFFNAQFAWEAPNVYRQLRTKTNNCVCVDLRGSGLSDHVGSLSLDGFDADIEAVADRLGAQTFGIVAAAGSTKLALTYAAAHPDRVAELVLASPPPALLAPHDSPEARLFADLLNADIETFSENMAAMAAGWSSERRERLAAAIRSSTSQEAVRRFVDFLSSVSVASLLPSIRCPTLILHFAGSPISSLEVARELAAEIPNATLRVIEGSLLSQSPAAEPHAAAGRVTTILFTDIEAHTPMMQRLGDARGREVLREHERITREQLAAHGGREVKTMGDGFLASFGSAQKALECAVALQRAFEARNAGVGAQRAAPGGAEGLPEGAALSIRIALNAGEPIEDDDDLFGSSS